MPSHNHLAAFTPIGGGSGGAATATVKAIKGATAGQTDNPEGNYWAQSPTTGPGQADTYAPASATGGTVVNMASDAVTVTGGSGITGGTVAIGLTGGSQAHTNIQPFLALNYIIALQGTFPSRN